ncbi:AbiV family abortive infection protein [Fluviicola sp.]|uniref:AbiV family abortive infection protein n=1 Tax=Fluviicola sp. TaxID=1917219 RepID=UPI003D2CAFA1
MKRQLLEGLSAEEITRGMRLCESNANELYEDAETLRNANRLARAYTLYQLAIEEIGKVRMLGSLFYSLKLNKEIDYKKADKNFLSHQPKTKESVGFEQIVVMLIYSNEEDETKREQLKQYFQELSDEETRTAVYNDFKNISLYVSVNDGFFVSPKEVITSEMVDQIRTSATIRLRSLSSMIQILTDENIVLSIEKIANDPEYKFDKDMVELFNV